MLESDNVMLLSQMHLSLYVDSSCRIISMYSNRSRPSLLLPSLLLAVSGYKVNTGAPSVAAVARFIHA